MKLPQYDNRKPNTPLYDPNFGKDPNREGKFALWTITAFIGIPVCLGLVGWSVLVCLRLAFGH